MFGHLDDSAARADRSSAILMEQILEAGCDGWLLREVDASETDSSRFWSGAIGEGNIFTVNEANPVETGGAAECSFE
jgi:hypothetical protein